MAEKRPNFTELTDNGNYISDTTFNPKGMAGLYNFTNAFMDLILNKNINPKGKIVQEECMSSNGYAMNKNVI